MCTCYQLLMVDMGKLQTYYRLRLLHARVCVVALSLRRLGGTRLLAGLDLRLSETDCGDDRAGIVGVRLRGAKVGTRLEEGHCLLMGCRLEC